MKNRLLSKDFVIPNLLVLPMVIHWLLPSGIENRMYISLAGVAFFLPNIFYLLYVINYKQLHVGSKRHLVKSYIALLSLLFLYTVVHTLGSGYAFSSFTNVLFGNLTFVYLPLLFFLFPLDLEHADKTKYLLAISLVFISFQVIIYGLGIMTYTSATGDDLTANEYDIGGVFRVSTTVGASTGSALIIALIGILIVGFYKFKPYVKIPILVLATVAIFLTLSRGPILLWCLYLLTYVLKLFGRISFKNRFWVIVLIVSGVYIMERYGVFDPFRERIDLKNNYASTDVTSGRNEFNHDAMNILKSSDYFGVGSGRVFPEKQLVNTFKNKYNVRMHNTYLVYLAELGVLGGSLYFLLYLLILTKTDFKRTSLGWGLLMTLVISFNSEAVFVYSEYLGIVLLLVILSQKWNTDSSPRTQYNLK